MKYDAVVFDFDGTLIESTEDDISWIYKASRNALEVLGKEEVAEDLSGEKLGALAGLDGHDRFERLCRECSVDPDVFWKLVSHFRTKRKLEMVESGCLEAEEGAAEVLKLLFDRGFRLGLVSNAPDESVVCVVEYLDWDQYLKFFRGITDFEDMNYRKPDHSHLDLAGAELKAENIVYVGDTHVDIEAASSVGWDSIVLGRNNSPATYCVDKLPEIPSLLD